jgi:hypothetical protein
MPEKIGLTMKGNVYLERYVNGVLTGGMIGPLNASMVEYDPGKSDSIERQSYRKNDYGQLLDGVVVPGIPTLAIKLDDADAEVLALPMRGSVTAVTEVSGTVTGETATAFKGRSIKLARSGVSSLVVTNSAGSTTYVLGTDYTADLTSGVVMILEAGAITDGLAIKFNYSYAARNGKRIAASALSDLTFKVFLDGVNMATQKACQLTAGKVQFMPKDALNLIDAKKFVDFTLVGNVITMPGAVGPVEWFEAA